MHFWGIDVGTTNTAVTRMDDEGNVEPYFLKFDSNEDPYVIHCKLQEFLSELDIQCYDVINIESVFYRFNIKTLIRLSRVAHSLYVICSSFSEDVGYVDNNTWRSQLFGTSKIKKEECQKQAYEWWPVLQEYKKTEKSHMADSTCIAEYSRRRYLEKGS